MSNPGSPSPEQGSLHRAKFEMMKFAEEEGAQTQTFGSGYPPPGGGLPREGVGAKKFGMSLDTQKNQTFGRDIPRDFCRDIPGEPEKFEKKVCVQFLAPIDLLPSQTHKNICKEGNNTQKSKGEQGQTLKRKEQ